MSYVASVILPTYNRRDHLRQAIASSLDQTVPVEVIVLDDGSTDGTAEMIQKDFPHIRYERFTGPKGPCFLRTRGAEIAATNYLFPIDDDAFFASSRTVEQTLADFSSPRIGAVAIPFINIRRGPEIQQQPPGNDQVYITDAFVGASHAVRRDVFLAAGAYHVEFFYMGEEGDLCLRMLDRGYVTRLGTADPLHHMESPLRVSVRAARYGRQNDVLFAVFNVPSPEVFIHLPVTIAKGFRYALLNPIESRVFSQLYGQLRGLGMAIRHLSRRHPVTRETYRLARLLKRERALPLTDVEPMLRPLQKV